MKIKTIFINLISIMLCISTVLTISKSNLKSKNTEKSVIEISKIIEKQNMINNIQVKY